MLHHRIPIALVLAALVASVTWSACGGGGGSTCQPSAETCNGLDDDCDGQTDEGFDVGAACTSGIGACAVTGQKVCSAGGAASECSAVAGTPSVEICNQADDDCDGQTDNGLPDCCQPSATRACGADVGVCQAGAETCSAGGAWGACLLAGQPVILPGTQAESCNGLDDDCDGQTDEPDATGCTTFYEDRDADTYGTGSGGCLCAATAPFTATVAGDCDDADATMRPGAAEACNGKDDDCDGQTDEGFGLGAPCSAGVGACIASGQTVCSADGAAVVCNATPGTAQAETCNGVDDDCNGATDEGLSAPLCPNQLGVCAGSHQSCGAAAGWLACAPTDYGPSYQATETTCDGKDNDCDGSVDEGFTVGASCSAGVGACQRTGVTVCSAGGAGVECGAVAGEPIAERCNGIDDDCDGATDESFLALGAPCTVGTGICTASGVQVCAVDGLGTTCSATPGAPRAEVCNNVDDDCDGATDGATVTEHPICEKQGGACAGATKPYPLCQGGAWSVCTDAVYAAYSAAYEPAETRCDGLDNDCDGSTDEGFGIGAACSVGIGACTRAGVLVCKADQSGATCSATPGLPQTELCNGIDDDCDGATDEVNALGCSVLYTDVDGDGYGRQPGACLCAPSPPYTSPVSTDCNDASVTINPGASERCANGMDDDCDGQTDESPCIG